MLSDEEKKTIHLALDVSGGDRELAAEVLGMTPLELKDTIHGCPELKAKWATPRKTQAPTQATVIDRNPLVPTGPTKTASPILDDPQVQALVRENAKFNQGLALLGLNADETAFAESLQIFQKRHFRAISDVIGGGASAASMKLSYSMTKMVDRLNNKEPLLSDSWEIVLMMCAELRKLGEMVNDLIIKQAVIELKKKEQATAAGPKGKPGFAPLQKRESNVQVNVMAATGSKVEVKEGNNGQRN